MSKRFGSFRGWGDNHPLVIEEWYSQKNVRMNNNACIFFPKIKPTPITMSL